MSSTIRTTGVTATAGMDRSHLKLRRARCGLRPGLGILDGVEQDPDVEAKFCQSKDRQGRREELDVDVGRQRLVKDANDPVDGHEDQQDQVDGEQTGLELTVLLELDILPGRHTLQGPEQLDVENTLAQDIVPSENRRTSISESPSNRQRRTPRPRGYRPVAQVILHNVDDNNRKQLDCPEANQEIMQPIQLLERREDSRATKVSQVHGRRLGDEVTEVVDNVEPQGGVEGDEVKGGGDEEEDCKLVDELGNVDNGEEVVFGTGTAEEDHTREGVGGEDDGGADEEGAYQFVYGKFCGDE